jgi:hypothetical protein
MYRKHGGTKSVNSVITLDVSEEETCKLLVRAIIKDTETLRPLTLETNQNEIYISFIPPPPQNNKILKLAAERVKHQIMVDVKWKIIKATPPLPDGGPLFRSKDEIYASVIIN